MTVGIDARQPLWFYDFVSPFTYLLLEQHDKWPGFDFVFTPVVLNDLYGHWGQRPAYSVPAKRTFMYRHALFRAEQLGIPYKMPPAHPFDSMKPLLLATAANGDISFVREIFRFIWREGRDPSGDHRRQDQPGTHRVGVQEQGRPAHARRGRRLPALTA